MSRRRRWTSGLGDRRVERTSSASGMGLTSRPRSPLRGQLMSNAAHILGTACDDLDVTIAGPEDLAEFVD